MWHAKGYALPGNGKKIEYRERQED